MSNQRALLAPLIAPIDKRGHRRIAATFRTDPSIATGVASTINGLQGASTDQSSNPNALSSGPDKDGRRRYTAAQRSLVEAAIRNGVTVEIAAKIGRMKLRSAYRIQGNIRRTGVRSPPPEGPLGRPLMITQEIEDKLGDWIASHETAPRLRDMVEWLGKEFDVHTCVGTVRRILLKRRWPCSRKKGVRKDGIKSRAEPRAENVDSTQNAESNAG